MIFVSNRGLLFCSFHYTIKLTLTEPTKKPPNAVTPKHGVAEHIKGGQRKISIEI